MKIRLNLANPPSFDERFGLWWAIPTAVLALVILAWLSATCLAQYRVYKGMQGKTRVPEQKEAEAAARERDLERDLERPEFRGTLREAQFVNSMIDQKELSLAQLTVKVTKLVPADARLSGISLTRSGNQAVLRFQLLARDGQAVEDFLKTLESSADFVDVSLSGEGVQQVQAPQPATYITAEATARYVGATGE
jgi:hypothetical protein